MKKKIISYALLTLLTAYSTVITPLSETLSLWTEAKVNSWAAWIDLKTKNIAAETLKTIEAGKQAVERAERTKAITRLTERKTELTQLLHKGFKSDVEYLCKLPLTWTPEEKIEVAIKAGKITAEAAAAILACYVLYRYSDPICASICSGGKAVCNGIESTYSAVSNGTSSAYSAMKNSIYSLYNSQSQPKEAAKIISKKEKEVPTTEEIKQDKAEDKPTVASKDNSWMDMAKQGGKYALTTALCASMFYFTCSTLDKINNPHAYRYR